MKQMLREEAVMLPDGSLGIIRHPYIHRHSKHTYVETPEGKEFATFFNSKDLIFLGEI